MAHVELSNDQITNVRALAAKIADNVQFFVEKNSSVSVERAILRLYGVDGVTKDGIPLPNFLVDQLHSKKVLQSGVSKFFAHAMLESKRDSLETASLIAEGKVDFGVLNKFPMDAVIRKENELAQIAINKLDNAKKEKESKKKKCQEPKNPWKYLIVATGNIYEDRTQAIAAVNAGADVIAVIRTTGQSLLDYVPYGATTEGFGGTYATQENFKIMRKALDEASFNAGRYIRLTNYSSGLCMAEIAACAAMENLDMLLNDSMYGILFRDINMKRTFIDQYFSRLICSRANIVINTGEDNYLTTSDAVESAHTVTASQLINEALAKKAYLSDELLGLGHAFEINPEIKNSFLLELAHAQLARQLFPKAPLKYMPPTKYKSTDIFFSHCQDTMFNLASIATAQGIHLAGILTEAIHTPLMQDRHKALKSINYIFNTAADLGNEIEFKKGGFIEKRAQFVLDEVESFLKEISEIGLMDGISKGKFADIKRAPTSGKGLDGVFEKSLDYSNPIMDIIVKDGAKHE